MTKEEIIAELKAMQANPGMVTESAYTPNGEQFPDHIMPFEDIHLTYLSKHRNVDPKSYLSNLRLMIRVRA